jgi:hypothetical protein
VCTIQYGAARSAEMTAHAGTRRSERAAQALRAQASDPYPYAIWGWESASIGSVSVCYSGLGEGAGGHVLPCPCAGAGRAVGGKHAQ